MLNSAPLSKVMDWHKCAGIASTMALRLSATDCAVLAFCRSSRARRDLRSCATSKNCPGLLKLMRSASQSPKRVLVSTTAGRSWMETLSNMAAIGHWADTFRDGTFGEATSDAAFR